MSPLSGNETKNQFSAVFSNLCNHFSANYPDESFVKNQWQAIAAEGRAAVARCTDTQSFEGAVDEVLGRVPMSHLYLVTPGRNEKEEQFLKDTAPESYAPKWRHFKDSIYLKIPSFTLPFCTFRDLNGILGANRDCNRFYLDLRLNAGGSLSEVGWLLSLFAEPGQVFCRTLRRGWEKAAESTVAPFEPEQNAGHCADVEAAFANERLSWVVPEGSGYFISRQVIIITGHRTHSAGEVFTAAMRDLSSPIIVGGPTAGACAVCRDDFNCGQGYRLCAPFGIMASSTGEILEGSGIQPHLPMDFNTPDTEMITGLELLAIEEMVE